MPNKIRDDCSSDAFLYEYMPEVKTIENANKSLPKLLITVLRGAIGELTKLAIFVAHLQEDVDAMRWRIAPYECWIDHCIDHSDIDSDSKHSANGNQSTATYD